MVQCVGVVTRATVQAFVLDKKKEQRKKGNNLHTHTDTHTHSPRILWGSFVLGQNCVIKVRSHNHFDFSVAKIPWRQITRLSDQACWARLLPGVCVCERECVIVCVCVRDEKKRNENEETFVSYTHTHTFLCWPVFIEW